MKYRVNYSNGKGDWIWEFLPGETDVGMKEIVLEMTQQYEWSEHFRGIEHELVERVPRVVVEHEIRKATSMIEQGQRTLELLSGVTFSDD